MSTEEQHRSERHDRIRRTKRLLRFLPRRATVHRYPILSRFSRAIRSKPYLWSFRARHVTPALYGGSILTFLPLAGIQLPLALLLSVVLRANLPIFAGLQLLTNPLTVAPIYYTTYQFGDALLGAIGAEREAEVVDEALAQELLASEALQSVRPSPGRKISVSRTINALLVGGLFCGTVVGLALDLAYRLGVRRSRAHPRPVRKRASGSTSAPDPPV